MNQAQDLLQQLQRFLLEGENVGPEVITDTLQKTEGLLSELSQQKNIIGRHVKHWKICQC
jgi:hypothetical protein